MEEGRRAKIIPRFLGERSCLKLVSGTLIWASRRWSRVQLTDLHRAQIARLRHDLAPAGDETLSVAA